VPLYTALFAGCISIEADVWLVNGTLYVGHEQSALTTSRTLASLYIDQLVDILRRQNPSSAFVTSPTRNGVFDADPSQTMYLFVDVKTDGESTWPAVVNALQPLRDAGYLTTYDGTGVKSGPVTVIGTGNTPLDQVQGETRRDYFFDAPASMLGTTFSNITSGVSPIASTDFADAIGAINGTEFSSAQLTILRSQVARAKDKGVMVRYWGLPAWPIATRNAVWSTLRREGVGLVNADNVVEAAGFGGINGYWG